MTRFQNMYFLYLKTEYCVPIGNRIISKNIFVTIYCLILN